MPIPVERTRKGKKTLRYVTLHSPKDLKVREYAIKVLEVLKATEEETSSDRFIPSRVEVTVVVSNAEERRALRRELKIHGVVNVKFQRSKSVVKREPFLRRNGVTIERVSRFAGERAEALRIMLETDATEEDLVAEANFVASLNGVSI